MLDRKRRSSSGPDQELIGSHCRLWRQARENCRSGLVPHPCRSRRHTPNRADIDRLDLRGWKRRALGPNHKRCPGCHCRVVVDVEDGDASVRGECRGSQRCIVEIAIATKIIAAGVVTGRPTEGIGGCGAVEQTGRACACSAGGGERCAPTTGSEWCSVETIITGLGPEGWRTLASAAQRESRRRQFG